MVRKRVTLCLLLDYNPRDWLGLDSMPYTVLNRDMNKDTRKALTDNIDRQLSIGAFKTADDFVSMAAEMIDLQAQGRPERWKSACTLAARRIIARHGTSGKVSNTHAESYVRVGLEAMVLANK